MSPSAYFMFFFFNDTATTEIYTLSLHDALPIYGAERVRPAGWSGLNQLVYVQGGAHSALWTGRARDELRAAPDRKSTRLNSSHLVISYAVFCLKKKKNKL